MPFIMKIVSHRVDRRCFKDEVRSSDAGRTEEDMTIFRRPSIQFSFANVCERFISLASFRCAEEIEDCRLLTAAFTAAAYLSPLAPYCYVRAEHEWQEEAEAGSNKDDSAVIRFHSSEQDFRDTRLHGFGVVKEVCRRAIKFSTRVFLTAKLKLNVPNPVRVNHTRLRLPYISLL